MKTSLRNKLCIALVGVGLLQSLGFLTKQNWLKGIGALTVASPLPIVFTEVQGVETFALNFYLQYQSDTRNMQKILITPEMYNRFRAPYNFRNVVGAAISYGPIMPSTISQPILQYAFQNPGQLSYSMGLTPPLQNASIFIESRQANSNEEWTLPILP